MPDGGRGEKFHLVVVRRVGTFFFDLGLTILVYISLNVTASIYCQLENSFIFPGDVCTCCADSSELYILVRNVSWALGVWISAPLMVTTLIMRFFVDRKGRNQLLALNVGLLGWCTLALLIRVLTGFGV